MNNRRHKYWLGIIVPLSFLVVLCLELVDHWPIESTQESFTIFVEVLFFGLGSSISVFVTLVIVTYLVQERQEKLKYMNRLQEANKFLLEIENWDELNVQLVRMIRAIVPVAAPALWLYTPERSIFEFKAGVNIPWKDGGQDANPTLACAHIFSHDVRYPACSMCACSLRSGEIPYQNMYCLPLIHSSLPAGILRLALPDGIILTQEQIQFLNDLAPEIAVLIDANRPQTSASIQAKIKGVERRNISRYLHGMLNQNIALLQFKLDELLTEIPDSHEQARLRRELQDIHTLASQTNQYVRRLLTDLNSEGQTELADRISEFAARVSQRAGFSLRFSCDGDPAEIHPHLQRQVAYILEEVLANIEKHANANVVHLKLSWGEKNLYCEISDNGIGFDPEKVKEETGHFGLAMIDDIAEEIHAEHTFTTAVNEGTKFVLSLPILQTEQVS